MALEVFETGADDYGLHVKALICGAPGAGKTLISSTFPHPFYASAEGGLMSVARRRIRGTKIESSAQLRELRQMLDQPAGVRETFFKGPVETVVIDTIDEIQRILAKERMAAKKSESLDQQGWGWLGDQMRTILRAFRNLEMNVVFTCHLKESQDQSSGQIFVKPALQGAVGDEIAQYMDLALLLRSESRTKVVGQGVERYEYRYLQTYKDAQHDWIKDRSGQLPAEIPVNFEDDYERMRTAIFGWVSEGWDRSADKAVEILQQVVVDTAPTAEASSVVSSEILRERAAAHSKAEEEVRTPLVEQEEPLKVNPEPVDTIEPPSQPIESEDADNGPWVCERCGDKFDSADQKELSEIMMREVLDAKCYRQAVEEKKAKK